MAEQKDRTWKRLPLIALTIILWVIFAPTKVGGRASYILVSGGSMEPNFHRGDLVITLKAASYQVGEAVAYFDPLLDGVIYHRIVEDADGRYILQGDANDWLDNHEPVNEEILGREWIYLPGFGRILETARKPAWLVTIAVVFVLLTVWPDQPGPAMPDGKNALKKHWSHRGLSMSHKQNTTEYFSLSLALAFLGLIGLIFFSTRPARQLVESFSAYEHMGQFSYSAAADEKVYEAGVAASGDPIFRQASPAMQVAFDYVLAGEQTGPLSGEYQLDMVIADDSGWQRKLRLIEPTPFEGAEVRFQSQLFFYNVQRVIDDFEKVTLVERGGYVIKLVPTIRIAMENGRLKQAEFSPELRFLFSPLEVRLLQVQDEDVLAPRQEVVFMDEEMKAATFSIFGVAVPVRSARVFFGLLLAASLGGAGFLYWQDHRITTAGGYPAARYQYGRLIVNVNRMPELEEMAELASLEELAVLAENHQVGIMHMALDDWDYYFSRLPWDSYYTREPRPVLEEPGVEDIPATPQDEDAPI